MLVIMMWWYSDGKITLKQWQRQQRVTFSGSLVEALPSKVISACCLHIIKWVDGLKKNTSIDVCNKVTNEVTSLSKTPQGQRQTEKWMIQTNDVSGVEPPSKPSLSSLSPATVSLSLFPSPSVRCLLSLISFTVYCIVTDTHSSLAEGLAFGMSIWPVAIGAWRVRRGGRKRDEGWEKAR